VALLIFLFRIFFLLTLNGLTPVVDACHSIIFHISPCQRNQVISNVISCPGAEIGMQEIYLRTFLQVLFRRNYSFETKPLNILLIFIFYYFFQIFERSKNSFIFLHGKNNFAEEQI